MQMRTVLGTWKRGQMLSESPGLWRQVPHTPPITTGLGLLGASFITARKILRNNYPDRFFWATGTRAHPETPSRQNSLGSSWLPATPEGIALSQEASSLLLPIPAPSRPRASSSAVPLPHLQEALPAIPAVGGTQSPLTGQRMFQLPSALRIAQADRIPGAQVPTWSKVGAPYAVP